MQFHSTVKREQARQTRAAEWVSFGDDPVTDATPHMTVDILE